MKILKIKYWKFGSKFAIEKRACFQCEAIFKRQTGVSTQLFTQWKFCPFYEFLMCCIFFFSSLPNTIANLHRLLPLKRLLHARKSFLHLPRWPVGGVDYYSLTSYLMWAISKEASIFSSHVMVGHTLSSCTSSSLDGLTCLTTRTKSLPMIRVKYISTQ